MSYNLGMIVSMVFVVAFILLGGDMYCLQSAYSYLDSTSIVVGYLTGMSKSYQKTFITRMLGDLDIPVLFGFPSGHEYPFINLPIGATVEVSPNGLKIVSEVYTD